MTTRTKTSIALANEAATANLMADLALLIGPGDVIALSGDLGAGKTAAARAFIRYLAGDDDLEVPSPTFTLAQSYDLPSYPLLHADLYRINDPAELEEIGLIPFPEGVVVLIEWPERAPDLMPKSRIDILFTHRPSLGTQARAAEITGFGDCAAKVARLIALREFLTLSGSMHKTRIRMAGDASTRSYARLAADDKSTILMNSPPRPDGPALYDGKSYSAAVHLAEDVKPFVAVASALRYQGYSAPAVYSADLDTGFLITEDLGNLSFVEGSPPQPIIERYEAAVDLLAALHTQPLPTILPIAPHVEYQVPIFDVEAMAVEIGLMLEWYLPDHGLEPTSAIEAEFKTAWEEPLAKAAAAPRTWMLRDFHSPNLIWLENRPDTARVGLIDFQDMVLGPETYDLVSLLQDARIDVPEMIEIAMLAHYVKQRRDTDETFDPSGFAEIYAIMSAQRNTRLLGTFARLNRRDNKPQYLKHQPRVWGYLNRALVHPSLARVKDWCRTYAPQPVN
jgi:tRNA threonylcarbamoyl adenosine modification protein YjeE